MIDTTGLLFLCKEYTEWVSYGDTFTNQATEIFMQIEDILHSMGIHNDRS